MRKQDSFCSPTTILQILENRLSADADNVAFEFLNAPDSRTSISYVGLRCKSLAVANALKEVCDVGDRVLLPTNNDASFPVAFLGCLYAGCIAVPIQVPRVQASLPDQGLGQILGIIEDAAPKLVLVDEQNMKALEAVMSVLGPQLPSLRLATVQSLVSMGCQDVPLSFPSAEDVAFLQYTSGSTSSPKGLMITHECIVNNQRSIQDRYQMPVHGTGVSWLPFYHDMGLSSGFLMPLVFGIKTVIMPPLLFAAKPDVWLREISRYDVVGSGGPNFAYSHCVSRIKKDKVSGFDLTGWQLAFCGAEPIRPETLDTFCRHFAEAGFKRTSFFPSYGLAEGTLFVSGKVADREPSILPFAVDSVRTGKPRLLENVAGDAIAKLVGCGPAGLNIEIKVIDVEGRKSRDSGEIGEICVKSNAAAKGYWNKPLETRSTFCQTIDNENGYFRTGDLGFLYNGELFVTGRKKEIIIFNGVNYYPQDIEMAAQKTHEAFAQYKAAAFCTEAAGNERLVLVIEGSPRYLPPDYDSVISGVKKGVRLAHQLVLDDVVIVPPGKIPKTTSGKVKRLNCKSLYIDGFFESPTLATQE